MCIRDSFYLDGRLCLICCPQGVEPDGMDYWDAQQYTVMMLEYDFTPVSYTHLGERYEAQIAVFSSEIHPYRKLLPIDQGGAHTFNHRRIIALISFKHGKQTGVKTLSEPVLRKHDKIPFASGNHVTVALSVVEHHKVFHI